MPASPRFATAVRATTAAVVMAAAVIGIVALIRESRQPARSRSIEARLVGVGWAPLSRAGIGGAPPSESRLAALLGSSGPVRGRAPASRHHEGVAHLLAGRTRNAVSELRTASESDDPRVWSDLAAACLVAANELHAFELVAEALTAAENALRLNEEFPEALFNRALALETLGMRDDARLAWQRYLAVDGGSDWAREAREHWARLAPLDSFKDVLARDYATLTTTPEAAFALAVGHPEDARRWGETRILGRWADAELRGETADAARHLDLARSFATALATVNDDAMLRRSVAAIDGAATAQRRALAAAHAALNKAHDMYNESGQPEEAEKLFRAAAADFRSGASPMALVARYYAANMVYEQGRAADALSLLEPLLATVSSDFPSLRAGVLWEIGLCHAAAVRWGLVLDSWNESVAIFERLGEPSQASVLRGMLASTYERLGDSDAAWVHRTIALRGIGRFTNFRLQQALSGIARDAIVRRDWPMACSFLNLEVEIGRRAGDVVLLADSLLVRAVVRFRQGDSAAAQSDLAEAGAMIASVRDPAFGARLRANELATRAMVEASPATAISLLTAAISFHSERQIRPVLPNLFLQRARALRATGDLAGARADLERGIAELESHRESLPAGEARWGAFHAAEELFEEAIEVALLRHDVEGAFTVNERARARSLLDTYETAPVFEQRSIPADTVIVEYAVLPERLVIFTADAARIGATAVAVDRRRIEREVGAFLGALRSNDAASARTVGARLHALLVAPVEGRVPPGANLVFVRDRSLALVPFAALVDGGGRYLIESHAVVAAPSAATFAAAARTKPPVSSRRVVIVTRSEGTEGGDRLESVEREAKRIARRYETAILLSGNRATIDRVERESGPGAAVHFGGHAFGDPSGLEPASIVFSDGREGEHRASVPEIAGLRLRGVSLVVLAACETAIGERRSLEGPISIAYGFLAAGAPTVIATLWRIDDRDSASFFPRLHERIVAGMRPVDALRAIQIESIRDGEFSLAMWTSVEVIGS